MNEVWKDIPEFEGLYQASTLGRIRSLDRRTISPLWNQETQIHKGKILMPVATRDGKYHKVGLSKNGKYYQITVHRLIGKTFILNSEDKPMINHKNGIVTDNRVCNLEWVTDRENKIHAINILGNGLGERNGSAKLTKEQVLNIRILAQTLTNSHKEIAQMFHISRRHICTIVNRKCWRHI